MLHDNYNQALVIVKHDDHVVEEAKSYSLHIMDEGLKSWKTAQDEYFLTVGDESESQVCAIAYVELLQKLRQLESKYTSIIPTVPDYKPHTFPVPGSKGRTFAS